MSWLILFLAGVFEVAWAVGLKYTQRPEGIVWTGVCVLLSMVLLAISMKHIPLGTAYAMWTGIGAVGTFIVGIMFFQEPANVGRFLSVGLIIAGLVGLKVSGH